jgi:hypothetical protein
VPGHSISAGSTHPDYHTVNDEIEGIEFDNVAAIVRAIFVGGARIADDQAEVKWLGEPPKLPTPRR